VSVSANELRFFADTTTYLPTGTQTIGSVPLSLSMNTLTLNGRGPNSTTGFTITIGDNTSTWTIGNGTTGTVNLNSALGGGSADRDVRYTVAPNLILNQTTTTFTGNSGSITGARFTGNITETASGYGITKSGSHLLIFSGTNTYTGMTLVSAGTLRLMKATALPGGTGATGGTSALTINAAVVELAGGDFQRNLGTGSSQFQITGGTSGFSALGAPRVITVNNDATQELVLGSATFQPSTLVLNAATANNALWLANKINLSSASTRTIQVDANVAILPGVIRNTAAGGLTKTGGGTLVLTGNNSYNGATTITVGALSVGAASNLGAGAANLVFNGGGIQITGTTLTNISGIGHTVTFTATKPIVFDIDDPANTFTVDQVLNQTSGTLTKSGAGTLVLNKANTFTGATTLYGGPLVLDYGSGSDNSKLSDTTALTLGGGNLVLRGGTHPEVVSATTISGNTGNTISRDGGTATIDLKAITVGGLSALNISEDSIAKTSSLTTSGILGGGAITVGSHFATKSGSDIVTNSTYTAYSSGPGGGNLTTVNQWTGGGTLTSGLQSYALRISNSGNSDVLNIGANNFTVPNGGTILYAGGFDNNFTINGTGRLTSVNGNQPMHVAVYAGTLTLNVRFPASGSSTLAKSGAGTLVAGAANDYGLATYVEQGVLRLANNLGAGTISGGIVVRSGAALELIGNITVGAEALTLSGTGISNGGSLRNISGINTYGGAITIGGGARIIADSGSLTLTGGIATTGGQNLTFGGAGDITVSNAVINGAANLIKDGSGTLGLVVTDNAVQSVCGDMTLNTSTFQLTFAVAPSPTVAPLKIMGNLTFSGTPTIKVSVNPLLFTQGFAYPLLTVGGSKPETLPTVELVDVTGKLKWVGNTLFLAPQGTIISFH
jgi:autotransporter-associated beta strand protein